MATMTPQQIAVIIQAQLGTSFQATTQQVNAALAALGANANAAGGQAAAGLGLSNQQLMNMQFQMNDMAVMLASGQNPFILIMQQGMQIVQTLDSSKGITGALKAIGAGFVTFITNPLNLMIVALAAVAGGIYMLFNAVRDSGPTTQEILDQHDETIRSIADGYGEAATRAERFARMTAGEALLIINADHVRLIDEMRDKLASLGSQMDRIWSMAGPGGNAIDQVGMAFNAFQESIRTGAGDFDALVESLARIRLEGGQNIPLALGEAITALYNTAVEARNLGGDLAENAEMAALLEAGVKNLDLALQGLGASMDWAAMKVGAGLANARAMIDDMARAAGGEFGLAIDTADVEAQAAFIRKTLEATLSGPELEAELARLDATVAARLATLGRRAAGSAGTVGAAITEVFRTEADAARDAFDEIEQLLSFQVQTYQITNQQRLAQLRAAKDEELRIIVDALTRQLAVEGLSADQRARINADIEEAERDHQRAMAEIIQTGIADQMKLVEDRWNSFTSSITSAIQGLLRGTMTLGDAIKSVLADMVLRWIEAIRKMVVQWVVGQRAKTASAAAGAAARTGIAAGEAAATAGVERLGIIRSILARAREVFAKVFSFMAPVMGPAAAAPAAASQAAVAAQAAIPLAVGAWDIPRDMLALVHKGETVVPRTFAEGMREGGGAFGGKSITFHYHAPARGGGNTGFWRREAVGMFDAFEEEARRRNIWTPQTARG